MTIKCQYVTCFIQRTGIYQSLIIFVEVNHVMNKGDSWRSRKKVDVAHQAIKGYKTISKEFGLLKSTVRQIVYKWRKFKYRCYLSEKWSTNKDHSKAERVIVCEVAKVPRVASKQLKAFLTLANVNVHEPTIRGTLSNHGVHGRVARRKPLFSRKKSACQRSCGQVRGLLEKGLMDGWYQNRTYWFK